MNVDISKALNELQSAFSGVEMELDQLRESVNTRMLDLEDIGWDLVNGRQTAEGPDLDILKRIVPGLRDMAATNPLHVRGAQLRHAYIFGRGVNWSEITNKTKKAIEDPHNQSTLFSVEAHETNNLALFTDGNLFIVRDEPTNDLTAVPLEQIAGEVTDPDDTSRVRYFLRRWADGAGNEKQRWYPLARYKRTLVGRGKRGPGIRKTITVGGKSIPVAQDQVIYHRTTKRQVGWAYGIPDSLAAKVWSFAYSKYLTNNATLIEALQQFAWAVTTATKKSNTNAAVAVATSPSVGGTGLLGSGNTLGSVGVPSAQVNMNNGQPLAAMVATSFGVPVIALLSSPGATGGSYGAATTLDTPTIKGMKAVQDSWIVFYKEILQDMGSPDANPTFPNILQNEAYREAQAIGLAYADGRLHQDEAREGTLDLLDVPKLHKGNPKPDKFNAGTVDGEGDPANPEPTQGNTGSVPGGVDQNTGNHDGDTGQGA